MAVIPGIGGQIVIIKSKRRGLVELQGIFPDGEKTKGILVRRNELSMLLHSRRMIKPFYPLPVTVSRVSPGKYEPKKFVMMEFTFGTDDGERTIVVTRRDLGRALAYPRSSDAR